jgi:hypothetical protein
VDSEAEAEEEAAHAAEAEGGACVEAEPVQQAAEEAAEADAESEAQLVAVAGAVDLEELDEHADAQMESEQRVAAVQRAARQAQVRKRSPSPAAPVAGAPKRRRASAGEGEGGAREGTVKGAGRARNVASGRPVTGGATRAAEAATPAQGPVVRVGRVVVKAIKWKGAAGAATAAAIAAGADVELADWVQCGACNEWRELVCLVPATSIHKRWTCRMATASDFIGFDTWQCRTLQPLPTALAGAGNSSQGGKGIAKAAQRNGGSSSRSVSGAFSGSSGDRASGAGSADCSSGAADCTLCCAPGALSRGVLLKQSHLGPAETRPPICRRCTTIIDKREYCPVCQRAWRLANGQDAAKADASLAMLHCVSCSSWVHFSCEALTGRVKDADWKDTTYQCPTCRHAASAVPWPHCAASCRRVASLCRLSVDIS